jgi:hypothetical protein
MLSPTHDFEIFLNKICGKSLGEVVAAVDEEVEGMVTSPKKAICLVPLPARSSPFD